MPSQSEQLQSAILASGIECAVAAFSSGEDFIEGFVPKQYDIIFLDIFMGALTGIQTAEKIREVDVEVVIIFTTSSEDFTREGYRLNAYKYLIKPVQGGDVAEALELALVKRDRSQGAQITVIVDGDPVTIAINDIVFVESSNRKTIIHTTNGDYLTSTTTDAMEKFLPAPRFCARIAPTSSTLTTLSPLMKKTYRLIWTTECQLIFASKNIGASSLRMTTTCSIICGVLYDSCALG
jgi:DNA-binding LytR/AlgR family response regulator